MNFEKLNEHIPYVIGGTKHSLSTEPYDNVILRMPGRHMNDTETPGGDFVVEITDGSTSWEGKQFTHQHIFDDFQDKQELDQLATEKLMRLYAQIVLGSDPDAIVMASEVPSSDSWEGTLNPQTLLYALQCLAVAEHRRYARFEKKMGGRFLPARFAAGIVYGHWTAEDAKMWVRKGRPGVEALERLYGKPPTLEAIAELVATV